MADAELLLILGNKNLSSWSLRPWVLLRHAGIPFAERVLPFETPSWRETILALSPSGRVPALRHGDVAIWDSLAICEYVAELFPEKQLWPEDRAARARARSVSAEMHSGFAAMRRDLPMDVMARVPRRTLSRETENDVARVLSLWTECRSRSGSGGATSESGPFLFGRFSVADAMFAPVAWRFRTYDVPIADAAARAYCDALLALPAMKEWEEASAAEVAALRATGPRPAPDPTSAQHCFAVIFTSLRKSGDEEGYAAAAAAMAELAARQPGYLGIESARNPDGFGITVSYWDSLEAIRNWKDVPAHAAVQARGRETFYERYEVRVATVERGYRFPT